MKLDVKLASLWVLNCIGTRSTLFSLDTPEFWAVQPVKGGDPAHLHGFAGGTCCNLYLSKVAARGAV